VTVGYGYSCAIIEDGSVYCWGANDFGQLGTGTTEPSAVPVRVADLSGVVSIEAAMSYPGSQYTHTCVRTQDGKAFCWGYNGSGELGNGTETSSITPVEVHLLV
jgi:alpha-tubulin suppressor-like RCC1 family protein